MTFMENLQNMENIKSKYERDKKNHPKGLFSLTKRVSITISKTYLKIE